MFGVWHIPLTGRQTLEGWKKPGGRAANPFPSPLIFKAMCTLMRNLIHVFLIHLHVWGRCSETVRPESLGRLFHPQPGRCPASWRGSQTARFSCHTGLDSSGAWSSRWPLDESPEPRKALVGTQSRLLPAPDEHRGDVCSKQREMRGSEIYGPTRSPHRARQAGERVGARERGRVSPVTVELTFQIWRTGLPGQADLRPLSPLTPTVATPPLDSLLVPPLSSVLNCLSPRRSGHLLPGHGSQHARHGRSPPADGASECR